MSTEKPIVIAVYVSHINCPHCGASQNGFLNDPRGGDFICDDCEKSYHVPQDALLNFG